MEQTEKGQMLDVLSCVTGHELPGAGYTEVTTTRYSTERQPNIDLRYWSWNYRGCWHQTCPPIDPR